MPKLTLAALLFALTLSSLGAQTTDPDSIGLAPRKWALQLARYEGLSLLRHTGPDAALRVTIRATSFLRPKSGSSHSTTVVEIDLNYLIFRSSHQYGSWYFGGGPFTGITSYVSDYSYGDSISWEYTSWNLDLGVKGIVGIRWHLSPRLVLFIENQTSMDAVFRSSTRYDRVTDEKSRTRDELQWIEGSLTHALIGATWYFR